MSSMTVPCWPALLDPRLAFDWKAAGVDSDNVAGDRFTDFFNLGKMDGKWIIANKIDHTHTGD